MCGDNRPNHALSALIEILADESRPLSMSMRRMSARKLRELGRLHEMIRLMTGRDDWRRMTEDECRDIQKRMPRATSEVSDAAAT